MRDIEIEHVLAYPREMVWEALTDSDQLAAWLMPNDFRPAVGHEFTFRTDPAPGFDGIVHCKVLALEPNRRLEISWRGGGIDTVVSFVLADHPKGTQLTLAHRGFRGLSNLIPRIVLGLGWRKLGGKIAAVLAGRRATA
jgi:uncharacterized protein YndB with AHSA1/START domain